VCIVFTTLLMALLLVHMNIDLPIQTPGTPRQFDWRTEGVVTRVKSQGMMLYSPHLRSLLKWMGWIKDTAVRAGPTPPSRWWRRVTRSFGSG
jgi:hypothetical protein